MNQEQYREYINLVCGCSEVTCFDPGPGDEKSMWLRTREEALREGTTGGSARGRLQLISDVTASSLYS